MKDLFLILCTIFLAALVLSGVEGCSAPPAPLAAPAAAATTPAIAASKTLVVAHRGGAALAPENTLAAFENALKIGVDMVETDVHLSKDGELVIMHDFTVSRTTDGTGEIRDLTLAEIKKLNAAAKFTGGTFPAQPVPTLGELLDLVKGKAGIQIEIKVGAGNARYPGIENKVVEAINARGMTDDVIIISFDFPTLKEIKTIDPRLKTGALVNAGWMSSRLLASPERILADAMDPTGADYFMPPASTVFDELVKAVHARGLKIGTWTVNVPQDMKRLAGWGVDAITSDKPDELKRVLGR
jgi:glycerophosphoryl diester phosphodiesterase